ncbi:MAG: glucuronate isomerase [Clostridia bacterium]|nr:glucuronate isomerase [Clostridia bacterium]MCD8040885.1 glucuronate isomerase [Clostridia bacterium]
MKKFMDKDFLLETETAKKLYHEHAEKMPIIDYHCHLQPKEIYEDKQFRNLAEVWLGAGDRYGDHYKWRSLRARGYEEDSISGPDDDYKKYLQFVESMPYFVGNPLYHWSHLEMQRYFDIDDIICPENAKKIWDKANEKLKTLTAREMMYKFNVKTVCTTDDPVDSLEWHAKMNADPTLKVKVRPAFRPDKAINVELSWFASWVNQLAGVVGKPINSLEDLCNALAERIAFFDKMGSKVSDHALDVVHYAPATYEEANAIFLKGMKGEHVSDEEQDKYKGYVLLFLGKEYAKYGWVQQYHIGALRNNSKTMLEKIGPDTGFDAIEDQVYMSKLSALLGALDMADALPKTILYCLNPRDNYALTVLSGCFQKEGVKGRVQVGTAWWFLDQQDGMKQNLETLMQVGLVAQSVGMLTDSRSFLAYPRHEYYRRILCNMLGNLVESGQYPESQLDVLGKIVENVCYNNAQEYFGF